MQGSPSYLKKKYGPPPPLLFTLVVRSYRDVISFCYAKFEPVRGRCIDGLFSSQPAADGDLSRARLEPFADDGIHGTARMRVAGRLCSVDVEVVEDKMDALTWFTFDHPREDDGSAARRLGHHVGDQSFDRRTHRDGASGCRTIFHRCLDCSRK